MNISQVARCSCKAFPIIKIGNMRVYINANDEGYCKPSNKLGNTIGDYQSVEVYLHKKGTKSIDFDVRKLSPLPKWSKSFWLSKGTYTPIADVQAMIDDLEKREGVEAATLTNEETIASRSEENKFI